MMSTLPSRTNKARQNPWAEALVESGETLRRRNEQKEQTKECSEDQLAIPHGSSSSSSSNVGLSMSMNTSTSNMKGSVQGSTISSRLHLG
mmetsp:Transcript_19564/g.38754  ORF Transcript_19564/g.38754 Transcript_19564/m.38754 type:complete len:90 (+) Transcript_19564:2519-2788(+)